MTTPKINYSAHVNSDDENDAKWLVEVFFLEE